MTSEVVVMNRSGVALAADSAVTFEIGDIRKVKNSALKLFRLSKYRPVGIMVYNNASLLGVPVETIIKLFRQELGKRSYVTLQGYGEALIVFLNGNTTLFPNDVQDKYFLLAIETEYRRILKEVNRVIVESVGYGDDVSQADVAIDVIEKRLQFWQNLQIADYFEVRAMDMVRRMPGDVRNVVTRMFGDLPIGERGVTMLTEIADHLVEKDEFPPDVLTGLVIAGFGEEEHFPVVQHFEIGGVYGDQLKVRPRTVDAVTKDHPSFVRAFAYKGMLEQFISGISGSLLEYLEDVTTYIRELPVLELEAISELDDEKKARAVTPAQQMAAAEVAEFRHRVVSGGTNRYLNIMGAVETLTIDELAQVASTLVGLNSFEQRMSMDIETVGEPVDVAVISKGDGFIWIDRKHYFRKDLNDHFFKNYYHNNDDEDGDAMAQGQDEEMNDDK